MYTVGIQQVKIASFECRNPAYIGSNLFPIEERWDRPLDRRGFDLLTQELFCCSKTLWMTSADSIYL